MEILGIGVLMAFAAGMISFLSPGVLPLVPVYVSYVTGKAVKDGAAGIDRTCLRPLWLSVLLVSRIEILRRAGRPLEIGAGVIMVLIELAMITGYITTFAYWMLRTFPMLG